MIRRLQFFIALMLLASAQAFSQSMDITFHGAKMLVPKDWEIDTTDEDGSLFLFAPDRGETDSFRENVNITEEELEDSAFTVTDYSNEVRKSLAEAIADFKVKSGKLTTGTYGTYYLLTFSGTIEGVQLHFQQIYVKHNFKVYTLTYVATEATFAKELVGANVIMQSFRPLK